MTDTAQPAPERLRHLVAAASGSTAPQPGIHWRLDPWLRRLPQYSDMLRRLPNPVARDDVRRVANETQMTPAGAVKLFIAAMVWGFGSVGYGPYRTWRILTVNDDASAKLHNSRAALIRDGSAAAYRLMASRTGTRLHGLGPAFGTKYLHFASPPASTHRQALILDRFVNGWITQHAGLRFPPWTWAPRTYDAYLTTMAAWAAELRAPPERLETLIFRDAVNASSPMSAKNTRTSRS